MIIREVEKTDLENGLTDIFIEGFRYHYNGRPDIFTNKSDDELKNDIENTIADSKVLVAIEDNQVVGYVSYEIREKHAKIMWIDQLVVTKKYRGMGYGGELMKKVEEIAKEKDCARIELECWTFNDNAVDMYDHVGFSKQRVKLEKKI